MSCHSANRAVVGNKLDTKSKQRGGAGKRCQWDREEKEYALDGKPQTETHGNWVHATRGERART